MKSTLNLPTSTDWEEKLGGFVVEFTSPDDDYFGAQLNNASNFKQLISQVASLLKEERKKLIDELIEVFKPYATEPMTGNVVILELKVKKPDYLDFKEKE